MFHKIKELRTDDNLNLYAIFSNGIEKVYNVRDMFSVYAPMKELEDLTLFRKAKISPGGYAIVWNDDLDLDAEEIWESGMETGVRYFLTPKEELAANLAEARGEQGLTQRDLSKATGIVQGDISKIENGNANPSLSTLIRLAEGMGKKLKVEFV